MKIVDIIQVVGGSATSSNPNNNQSLVVGNGASGEIYNENTIHIRPAGVYALPLPVGTINSEGVFTPAKFAPTSAQTAVEETNSYWKSHGVIDTRLQPYLGQMTFGEVRYMPEGNLNNNIYLNINGDQLFSAPQTFTVNAGANLTLTYINGQQVQITNSNVILGKSATDFVALASIVNANFTNLLAAANAGLAAVTPNDGGLAAFTAFVGALQSLNVASTVVKCQ